MDTQRFAGAHAPQGEPVRQVLPAQRGNHAAMPHHAGAASNAAAVAALRARPAPGGAARPSSVHADSEALPAAQRSNAPNHQHAAGLPTHQGGVRTGAHGWRTFERRGHTHWTPDWGYGPGQPVAQGAWGIGFGFGLAPCPCEPCLPVPSVYADPNNRYAAPQVYEEPVYVAPPEWPSYVAPAPVEPAASPAPTAAPPPYAQTQAARAETFGRAFEAFQAGHYEDALVGFEALVRADARDGEAWMAVAHTAFALERYPRAAQAVAQAAALNAFPRGYRFDPAPLYAREGAFEGLLGRLVHHVAATPKDADARLVLAWLFTSLGHRVEAQELIQQVLTLRPDDATAPVLAIALLPAPSAAAGQGAGAPAPAR